MTRIIAGTAGGRRISVPEGRNTRPTSDRAREALFSSVQSDLGSLDGARVMDLYAGSGAIGLEALSRGAAHALLVEADRRAAQVLRDNIQTLGLPGARLVADRVERVVGADNTGDPYDVVVADPPYAVTDAEVAGVLADLVGRGWLAEDAVVVVERSKRGAEPSWPEGLERDRSRGYGEAVLWYARPSPTTTLT
ncbi:MULTISPECIES: 16S rRNA (guanine(966)-N(2))-methyltransferase RsmD [Nocardiopsis]|uniref:Methyltransferase n=1 Tax=Nocardiopsis dassonvillei (strain ATCC 23218 / DSM 43111 / CIP 107115 / JCM 7437 / KCTC 9190 / NBRC 14626 / NCTC 10488 / NRRL B-5397 / IMRU 509) TaxID=446468 RepID=D7AUA0_NOCDD|nr:MULTISPECIES: 16S rRNA (guanine(966)-N(2))-methyltransferase RsmD [Nocardiopsis]ADH65658.1 methyltransferase [Nocardiopsis dassonvillei subsp. dassonvillei DSM 43111]APC34013.1 16S rRNA (guanine(966)-N(2))-methyltransferase RsmD [Nocardiopsis dassonvillei]ASU56877.1 RsmD family RNA methyltransferase [Nocardiopsis dassonvillei]NKY79697.1 16S rRNA (guanine(966)-N(2))-methyltransferase RsmD [Nocardiopsis dassonvillei]VEI91677.1 Ribosomal RNA small subunit methyltransferase D [Nocardiopsis dass